MPAIASGVPGLLPAAPAPAGFLSRAVAAVRSRLAFGNLERELASMSDRELSDIGISRSEIRSALGGRPSPRTY